MAQPYDPYRDDPYEDEEDEDDPLNVVQPAAPPHDPNDDWIEGRSLSPNDLKRFYNSAVNNGVPSAWADAYIARNPDDQHRLEDAFYSDANQEDTRTGSPDVRDADLDRRNGDVYSGGGGGNQTPTQQWNNQPPPVVPVAPVAPPPVAAPAEPTATQVRSDELYKLLMQRAQQGTAVGREDPNVRAQVDPAAAQLERASRNSLDEIAEKAGPLANLTGERRLAGERVGQASAQLEAEVIGREIEGRRQEIMQALQVWGAQLSDDERIELQRELGYLNDAARTADRNQNESQFGRSLAQDNDQFGRALDQGASQFGLTLGQNNEQFMRELALREWDTANRWDFNWASL